jgi:pyridoxamine 5'-phosphate oxidase
MEFAPWRSLLARNLHIHRNQPEARFLQLATIDLDGYPANRTVVFRGFLRDSDQLKFVTDRRSQKIQQLLLSPWAEACWYFVKTREQFRIRGKLCVVDRDQTEPELQAARLTAWRELSDAGRVQFGWAYPRQSRATEPNAFSPPQPSSDCPLDTFCLLLLEPTQVDHLELRGEPQNRSVYLRSEDVCVEGDRQQTWSAQAVNP